MTNDRFSLVDHRHLALVISSFSSPYSRGIYIHARSVLYIYRQKCPLAIDNTYLCRILIDNFDNDRFIDADLLCLFFYTFFGCSMRARIEREEIIRHQTRLLSVDRIRDEKIA